MIRIEVSPSTLTVSSRSIRKVEFHQNCGLTVRRLFRIGLTEIEVKVRQTSFLFIRVNPESVCLEWNSKLGFFIKYRRDVSDIDDGWVKRYFGGKRIERLV